MGSIDAVVAPLAKSGQVAIPVIAQVVVQVGDGEDDLSGTIGPESVHHLGRIGKMPLLRVGVSPCPIGHEAKPAAVAVAVDM